MSVGARPVAVVTGASSGIGAAIAGELVARGVEVIGIGRRYGSATAALTGAATLHPVGLDVADSDAVAALLGGLPRIDYLVCAAGGGSFLPVAQASLADLQGLLATHVVGTFSCVQAALPVMQGAQRGAILVIGSIAETKALPECGLYAAAKAGQAALMRSVAEEARAFGVRVCIARVGAVDTPMWAARPGFDRSRMMRPETVARVLIEALLVQGAAVEELTVMPPDGVMSARRD